jgi:Peptidase family M28/PA domain
MNTLLRTAAVLSTFLFAQSPSTTTDTALSQITPTSLQAEMRYLSDDLLEGRGTATRGHLVAAHYMASQFEALGLQPAGDNNTFFQRVPLRRSMLDTSATTLSLTNAGKSQSLVFGKDFVAEPDPMREISDVDAPVVFAGYGVVAPSQNYDDYKGIDAKGKIVAMLYGAPNFDSSIKAHYSSFTVKAKAAVEHGAVGIMVLVDPTLEAQYPFVKIVRDVPQPHFLWLDKQGQPGNYFPQLKAGVILSIPAVQSLFANAPHHADELFALAKDGKTMSFDLPFSAKIHTVTKSENTESPNVVARLEGSDPTLKSENVVYSAHLDHLGIGAAVDGDTIYNGALDNASGSAALLELARAFASLNPRPKRSILFVNVTGEEAGLLGSEYFAKFPSVPKDSLVANINIDEILMLWPLKDIIAFGAEHSSLQKDVTSAAQKYGLTLSPDPFPQEVIFIRSDQYSFVKEGVPAVMLSPGFTSDATHDPMKLFGEWEEKRYHQPQDDINQPNLDYNAATKLIDVAFLTGYSVAQAPTKPTWNTHDFFGDLYHH